MGPTSDMRDRRVVPLSASAGTTSPTWCRLKPDASDWG